MDRQVSASPQTLAALRSEVRDFLLEQADSFTPAVDSWMNGFSREFSRALGERGWLGMTWPTEYGGHARTPAERFVVMEELLAAGAPVSAHWAGDRQIGPALLRNGTEEQRHRFLPGMADGEILFCLGLSEPDSGSDLASVRTSARKQADGSWLLNGTKLWTSGAHEKDYMLTLTRSEPGSERREGLTQFIVRLDSPGISVHPVLLTSGEHHFNEVVLDEVRVEADSLLGTEGGAWEQVTSELADERAGPERYMSTVPLIRAFAEDADPDRPDYEETIGALAAQLWSMRSMSLEVVASVERGETPSLLAATAKDVGTRFEQESIESIRHALGTTPERGSRLREHLDHATMHSPGFTIRGGTTQVLRSIIAGKLRL